MFLLQKPAAGAADGVVAVKGTVIVQQRQRVKPVLFAERAELCRGGPPVIMISLDEIFLTGKLL